MDSLFVYGSLGPGRPNEHKLKKIGGTWKKGYVWGQLFEEGWGAQMGFPGIRLDEPKEKIPGYVFCSDNLEAFWEELDTFEGNAYQRTKTVVNLEDSGGQIEAYIYALR